MCTWPNNLAYKRSHDQDLSMSLIQQSMTNFHVIDFLKLVLTLIGNWHAENQGLILP